MAIALDGSNESFTDTSNNSINVDVIVIPIIVMLLRYIE